ncbi:nucleotide pyrophosphohydrolase [Halanaerobium congolense]|jgi:NTP pyrophosphatase (non-canonical NTP hydrolase)|uniref:NTP pyrophosphatase (Non-canonical NTP hydrolase) n=1 Tax=Halanaerobium congolense TaxID=54121 RepID=A0A4R7DZU3_9FIRM|nr:nucleotide pyrophosphohydrolase [Halanaerobium congolense]TDS26204.1 NTP pyrophosphatase (non-canonical NTP hydrolase) [Halanaerobium congolense]SDK99947.1 NTP pyrophosphatase, house-cleaning of non-canonical NTPs [Halanaerobium congolense]SDN05394.1 NTP pyrophosphatase, house-cleaning of non-canonical NTPs [Halanaerobium congolense]
MKDKILSEIIKFRDDRNWSQFHNPKDLAISISIESSELLELFQWNSSKETVENNLQDLKDELADIMIYCTLMADNLDIDLEEAVEHKLEKNKEKYPIEKAYNSKEKYDKL